MLDANGNVPDRIVGTSSGSLVGAFYAGGNDGKALGRFGFSQVNRAINAGQEAAERALPRILNVICARFAR